MHAITGRGSGPLLELPAKRHRQPSTLKECTAACSPLGQRRPKGTPQSCWVDTMHPSRSVHRVSTRAGERPYGDFEADCSTPSFPQSGSRNRPPLSGLARTGTAPV